jgi:hypothetical protein
MLQGRSGASVRAAMMVLTIVGLVSPVAACGYLEDRPSITDAVWLPNGAIYYEHVDFDGNYGMTRRHRSGSTSDVSLDGAGAILGSGCLNHSWPTLFVAPDGGLGLEYTCTDGTRLLERTASGGFDDIGTLPSVWGNVTTMSGSALTGIAMESVPAAEGSGTCSGIQAVRDGALDKPFTDVTWLGHTYYLSPPDSTACRAQNRPEGVWSPEIRRDGSYFTFLMSEPDAVKPSDAPSNDAEYLWWWPSGVASPLRVGPALDGVDSVSIDQQRQQVALSFFLGKDGGVAILDLASGRLRTIVQGTASHAAFSPDGTTVMYVNGSDEISFVRAQP